MEFGRRRWVRNATGAAGALIILLLVVLFVLEVSKTFREDREGHLIDTVGEIRNATLDEITAAYLSQNPKGQILVVEGERIAPLPYLNGQLRDMNASWRVRIVDDRIRFQEVA